MPVRSEKPREMPGRLAPLLRGARWARPALVTFRGFALPTLVLIFLAVFGTLMRGCEQSRVYHVSVVAHEAPARGGVVIGSGDDADLRLTEAGVAPRHALLEADVAADGDEGTFRYHHLATASSAVFLRPDWHGGFSSSGPRPRVELDPDSIVLTDLSADVEPTAALCEGAELPAGAKRYRIRERQEDSLFGSSSQTSRVEIEEGGKQEVYDTPDWVNPIRLGAVSEERPEGQASLIRRRADKGLELVAHPSPERQVVRCRASTWLERLRGEGAAWVASGLGAGSIEEDGLLLIGRGYRYRLTRAARPWGLGGAEIPIIQARAIEKPDRFGLLSSLAAGRLYHRGWKALVPTCNEGLFGDPKDYVVIRASGIDFASGSRADGAADGRSAGAGMTGRADASGTFGLAGASGSPGSAGASGRFGFSGASGSPGSAGASGRSGARGSALAGAAGAEIASHRAVPVDFISSSADKEEHRIATADLPLPAWALRADAETGPGTPLLYLCRTDTGTIRSKLPGLVPSDSPLAARLINEEGRATSQDLEWHSHKWGDRFVVGGQVLEIHTGLPLFEGWFPILFLILMASIAGSRAYAHVGDLGRFEHREGRAFGRSQCRAVSYVRRCFVCVFLLALVGCMLMARMSAHPFLLGAADYLERSWFAAGVALFTFPVVLARYANIGTVDEWLAPLEELRVALWTFAAAAILDALFFGLFISGPRLALLPQVKLRLTLFVAALIVVGALAPLLGSRWAPPLWRWLLKIWARASGWLLRKVGLEEDIGLTARVRRKLETEQAPRLPVESLKGGSSTNRVAADLSALWSHPGIEPFFGREGRDILLVLGAPVYLILSTLLALTLGGAAHNNIVIPGLGLGFKPAELAALFLGLALAALLTARWDAARGSRTVRSPMLPSPNGSAVPKKLAREAHAVDQDAPPQKVKAAVQEAPPQRAKAAVQEAPPQRANAAVQEAPPQRANAADQEAPPQGANPADQEAPPQGANPAEEEKHLQVGGSFDQEAPHLEGRSQWPAWVRWSIATLRWGPLTGGLIALLGLLMSGLIAWDAAIVASGLLILWMFTVFKAPDHSPILVLTALVLVITALAFGTQGDFGPLMVMTPAIVFLVFYWALSRAGKGKWNRLLVPGVLVAATFTGIYGVLSSFARLRHMSQDLDRAADRFLTWSEPWYALGGDWVVQARWIATNVHARESWVANLQSDLAWIAVMQSFTFLMNIAILIMFFLIMRALIGLSEGALERAVDLLGKGDMDERRDDLRRAGLFAAFVAFYLGWEMCIHVGTCFNIVPPTGLTLPWISNGGTASFTYALLVSIALARVLRAHKESTESEALRGTVDW